MIEFSPVMTKTYIGFSSTQHDSSVAMINEQGSIIFAEACERSLKNKRAHHSVPDSVAMIDRLLKLIPEGSDIAASLSWSNKGLFFSPSILTSTFLTDWYLGKRELKSSGAYFFNKSLRQAMYKAPKSNRDMLLNLEYKICENDFFGRKRNFTKLGWDHHLCHAATAVHTSLQDEGISVVMDGMGEGVSHAVYRYQESKLKKLDNPLAPSTASLGFFYAHVCWACGFDPLHGEEWKVMGLAPLGKLDSKYYALLRPMIVVRKGRLKKASDYNYRLTELLKLRSTFRNPIEAADLAFTGQMVFEEILFSFLDSIHDKHPHDQLFLSGGCALNSSANGKILAHTKFKQLHIPMAPGDDGNSVGAAILAFKKDNPHKKIVPYHSPYLGSEISESSICKVINLGGLPHRKFENENELVNYVAQALADKKLIGWCQGRAELGPRALGNRSILADARDESVKERINSLIKFREKFRPFAPSILHENGKEFFHDYQYTPYMDRTLTFSNTTSAPGVVHLNNSGRLQSVTRDLNPLYHALIKKYFEMTGVPLLLNTSFNVMGRPIIHDIEDALGVFFTSGLDMLVINQYVFEKSSILSK